MSTYRDSLSPEDREVYDRMLETQAANREHNRAKMDEAGVPRAARRGFSVATSWNDLRISEVTRYDRLKGSPRWGVFVELYPGSFTRYCWLVGPRGAARKIA
jgi:hypothetical protein